MNVQRKMMEPYDLQTSNEHRFGRKHIDKSIRRETNASAVIAHKVIHGTALIRAWLAKDHYPEKTKRLEQIQGLDIPELVSELFVGIAYVQTPELFTSISAQLANRLNLTDKREGIQTVAEILAVLCETDAFDIFKLGRNTSLMLQSRMVLSKQLMTFIEESICLPPMVCEPDILTNNRQSGYLTHNESVILKRHNHHDDEVGLDVINLQNQVPLALNERLIRAFEEPEPVSLHTLENAQLLSAFDQQTLLDAKEADWTFFKEQSLAIYALMVGQGNRFWLTHKVDKRGRLYATGYHINTQGTKFKKAIVELANKETVHGMP